MKIIKVSPKHPYPQCDNQFIFDHLFGDVSTEISESLIPPIYLNLDQQRKPWSFHMELKVTRSTLVRCLRKMELK